MSPLLPAAAAPLLISCATIYGPAAAGTPAAAAPAWSEPAEEPGEGSLWDSIEEALDGQPPPESVVEASGELAAERSAEHDFLELGGGSRIDRASSWYRDPLATLTQDPLFLDRLDLAEFDLPVVVNDDVKLWMRYFLGSGRKYYARYLARSTRYRPMIEAGLAERGMPRDLFYLAMIESGFSPQAYSKAAAVGLWQFMAPTARAYHLRVEWWVDERRDPELATDAALDHLQDLHGMFGDWYLAAAAYNAGAGRVRSAMNRSGGKDYWAVATPGNLARETCSYVPKLIAAAIIGHHPERYGFTGIEYQPALAYDTAQAPSSTSLEALATCAALDAAAFGELNPALRRWALPPEPETYPVRVPVGKAEAFGACVDAIPPSERVAFVRHVVRRGESLGSIARKYGVDLDEVVRMNNIENRNRIYVGTELVIPVPGRAGAALARSEEEPAARKAAPAPSGKARWHTVRSGETLDAIASRYGVSVQDLAAWNGIADADRIRAGQRLRVGSAGDASAPEAAGAAGTPARTAHYRVETGDTLSGIAAQLGVSVADLQRWNGIKDPAQIQVGQDLVVQAAAEDWAVYVVKRGDTLGAIAQRHGCGVDDLKAWNGIAGNTIYPGQKLRIRR